MVAGLRLIFAMQCYLVTRLAHKLDKLKNSSSSCNKDELEFIRYIFCFYCNVEKSANLYSKIRLS